MATVPKKTTRRKGISIRPEDVDDLGALMMCSVRYAIGRETYMPGIVQDFIRKYPQAVTENVKSVILRDIEENDRITEHKLSNGESLKIDHLGNTQIDRPGWLKFRDWLKELEVSGEPHPSV